MHRKRAIWIAIIVVTLAASFFSFPYFRDNFSTHYPLKTLSGAILRAGSMPWWNFYSGAGQPLAANPNTLTFYPTTILYYGLPPHAAFSLHFFIHLIAGWLGLRAAARAFGASGRAAAIGASSYLLGGAAISTLSFYNLSPAFALVPAAVASLKWLLARRRIWTDAAILGSLCGLLGLAGEPVIVLGAALMLLIVAAPELRREHILPLLVAVVIALAVASPLLIAYSEIAAEVERGFRPYSTATVVAASLRPERLLEMITGPFLGLVTDKGPMAYRYDRSAGQWPLFLPTVVIGPLLLIAIAQTAGAGARRLKIAGAALLFLALGGFNPIFSFAVDRLEWARIIRFPEKLALPGMLIGAILIALWTDQPRAPRRTVAVLVAMLIAAAAAIGLTIQGAAEGTVLRLAIGTALAAITLITALTGHVREAIAVHFFVLASWAVRTAPFDASWPYVVRSPLASITAGRLHIDYAGGAPGATVRDQYRIRALRLDPLWGLTQGVSYGTDRSPEGMYSYLSAIVNERMAAADTPLRVRYLRLLGVETIFTDTPMSGPFVQALPPIAPEFYGYQLAGPMGMIHPVSWPIPAASIQEAVARIESPEFDPALHTIVPASKDAIPSGRVEITDIRSEPQRTRFTVRAREPASVVFNQSYFSAWNVTSDGEPLRIFPANIDRLGIALPAGQREVTIEFGRRRAFVIGAWVLSTLLLLAAALEAIRSRVAIADPAR